MGGVPGECPAGHRVRAAVAGCAWLSGPVGSRRILIGSSGSPRSSGRKHRDDNADRHTQHRPSGAKSSDALATRQLGAVAVCARVRWEYTELKLVSERRITDSIWVAQISTLSVRSNPYGRGAARPGLAERINDPPSQECCHARTQWKRLAFDPARLRSLPKSAAVLFVPHRSVDSPAGL